MHWRLVTVSTRRVSIVGAWFASELRQSFAVRSGRRHVAESRAISASRMRATVGAPRSVARGSPPSATRRAFAAAATRASSRATMG